jgi:hypothetical protein
VLDRETGLLHGNICARYYQYFVFCKLTWSHKDFIILFFFLYEKTLGFHSWTQTGNGTCQKNEGFVQVKQKPVKMGGTTIYRTLSSKGHLFKLGLTDDPTCESCLEEDESATHVLCDCEAIAYLRFHHLGQYFLEPSDHYDAAINKVLI